MRRLAVSKISWLAYPLPCGIVDDIRDSGLGYVALPGDVFGCDSFMDIFFHGGYLDSGAGKGKQSGNLEAIVSDKKENSNG